MQDLNQRNALLNSTPRQEIVLRSQWFLYCFPMLPSILVALFRDRIHLVTMMRRMKMKVKRCEKSEGRRRWQKRTGRKRRCVLHCILIKNKLTVYKSTNSKEFHWLKRLHLWRWICCVVLVNRKSTCIR